MVYEEVFSVRKCEKFSDFKRKINVLVYTAVYRRVRNSFQTYNRAMKRNLIGIWRDAFKGRPEPRKASRDEENRLAIQPT